MAIKPQNIVPALKDKVVNFFIDLSEDNEDKLIFMDTENDYTVVSAAVVVYRQYSADDSAAISLGHSAYTDRDGVAQGGYAQWFVNNFSLGSFEMDAGTLVRLPLEQTYLPAGASLVVWQPGVVDQLGEVMLCVKLRPREKAHGNASKRPGASA